MAEGWRGEVAQRPKSESDPIRPIGARRASIIRYDPKCLSGSRINPSSRAKSRDLAAAIPMMRGRLSARCPLPLGEHATNGGGDDEILRHARRLAGVSAAQDDEGLWDRRADFVDGTPLIAPLCGTSVGCRGAIKTSPTPGRWKRLECASPLADMPARSRSRREYRPSGG